MEHIAHALASVRTTLAIAQDLVESVGQVEATLLKAVELLLASIACVIAVGTPVPDAAAITAGLLQYSGRHFQ